MLRKLTAAGVFILALAPSAYLAWTLRAMPHLGFYHDDSIYWVSAKSLAEGHEYRIASLPGQPYQSKYPPLYSTLLAGVWKIDGAGAVTLLLAGGGSDLVMAPSDPLTLYALAGYGWEHETDCSGIVTGTLRPGRGRRSCGDSCRRRTCRQV